MDLHLKGKNAVITGASQGIGKAIAKALAKEGVRIFATARSKPMLAALKDEIELEGGDSPVVLEVNFLEANAPEVIFESAIKSLGTVDILINNIGRSRPVEIIGTEDEWQTGMDLDFNRHRQLTELFLPQFIAKKSGSILNVTSMYELRSVNISAIAKASIVSWSKQLSWPLGRNEVRINCLQPGLIDTANTQRVFSVESRKVFSDAEIPLGDFGTPRTWQTWQLTYRHRSRSISLDP
jgi:3-oxoacyl-[acyl-carrier protein] reductase